MEVTVLRPQPLSYSTPPASESRSPEFRRPKRQRPEMPPRTPAPADILPEDDSTRPLRVSSASPDAPVPVTDDVLPEEEDFGQPEAPTATAVDSAGPSTKNRGRQTVPLCEGLDEAIAAIDWEPAPPPMASHYQPNDRRVTKQNADSAPSKPNAPASPCFDTYACIQTCRQVASKLLDSGSTLSKSERLDLINRAMSELLTDAHVPEIAYGEAARQLHAADPDAYAIHVRNLADKGVVLLAGIQPLPSRVTTNILLLLRPHLVQELGLTDMSDMLRLDAALAAYKCYLQLTTCIRGCNHADAKRTNSQILSHARTLAAADIQLKTYMNTLESLRNRRHTPRILQVKAGGDVAVQINESRQPKGPE